MDVYEHETSLGGGPEGDVNKPADSNAYEGTSTPVTDEGASLYTAAMWLDASDEDGPRPEEAFRVDVDGFARHCFKISIV